MPRMLTHNGKTLSRTEWAEELGISVGAMDSRLSKYPVEVALGMDRNEKPLRQGKPKEPQRVAYVRMPEALHRKLMEIATARGITLNSLCLEAFQDSVRQFEERQPPTQEEG
jgi:hypothetical protein